MKKKIYKWTPNYTVCPGKYIKEIMECYNISENDFADKIGVSVDFFRRLLNGEERITENIANFLYEIYNGYKPYVWLGLQEDYEDFNKKHKFKKKLMNMKDFVFNFLSKNKEKR